MKFSFSTENVLKRSFSGLCGFCHDYGFSGFEISDALNERAVHDDSIFRSDKLNDAKRRLLNKSVIICALTFPGFADCEEVSDRDLEKYVELAHFSGTEQVIYKIKDDSNRNEIIKKFTLAVKKAEESGIEILFESAECLADTVHLAEFITEFGSVCTGACWNIRETYFKSHETAEDTIKNLGAYIRFVRLGDKKGETDVLLGEGDLPVESFVYALQSLNYDSFVSCEWNDEIKDADLVLTHFINYMGIVENTDDGKEELYYNRSRTGVFPWKKFDILDLTFSGVLDVVAKTFPDQLCFKYTTLDYTRTYKQFKKDVDKIAASLISLGVKPGHHVAVWATNIPQWFLTFWATVKIGAVLVTVNTAYKIHEMEYLLKQSDTHTLVMTEGSKDTNYKAIMQELCPELKSLEPGKPLYCKKLPFLRNIVTVGFSMDGCLTWEQMEERSSSVPYAEVRRRASLVKPDDVANMQYTSGTTGFPKGVMLTHRNIINNGKIIGDRMDLSTADRMMIQVPMFHCFGMVLSMTSSLTHGATVSPLPYFSPKSSLACINDEKITCFNGVPTMFIAMFNHEDFKKTDFSHIRTGIMAGSNCPPELMRRAADEMNMKEIISVYGQTEASPGCTMGEVNEDIDHRVDTVGSAFPGVECKIIDPETGEDLPDGENGEFVARGYNIMKGYYKMPFETRQAIDENGWLHSGDICCRTPDGYYKVTGRLKDMIIRGGENLYPREIEEFYLTNIKVKDAAVIGVPDERYGEECCAWIILHDGETADAEEMVKFGNEHIARHKVPKYFIFTDKFPMNAAGKILKYKMKEESIERLGI